MNLLSPLAISDEFSTVRLQHNRAFTELLNAASSSLYSQVTGHIANIITGGFYSTWDVTKVFFNIFCAVKWAAHSAYRFINWVLLLHVFYIIVLCLSVYYYLQYDHCVNPCLFYRVSAQTHTVLL